MKRHVQITGVRRWAGDDLVELQSETLKVLDDFFSQYGNVIISGCEVAGDVIKPGIVALRGKDPEGNSTFKVVPFAGRTNGSVFPIYLKLGYNTLMREYGDQQTKPIAYGFYAILSNTVPTDSEYITINQTNNKRFIIEAGRDVIKVESHLKEHVAYLEDLYAKYPGGGVEGDVALVMRGTQNGACWAYWDNTLKMWRLMVSISETNPSIPPIPVPDTDSYLYNNLGIIGEI